MIVAWLVFQYLFSAGSCLISLKPLTWLSTHGDSLLNESVDHEEPMDTEDHREDTTEDALGSLGCGDKDIFEDDPLTASQLVAVVKASTLADSAVPSIGPWHQNILEESGLVESQGS